MEKKGMDLQQFNEYKGYALQNDPKVFTTNLGGIILEGDSYEKKYILAVMPDGSTHQLTVTGGFFKQLSQMLRVNLSLKNAIDSESFSKMLNTLRSLQSMNTKLNEVVLVYDPTIKAVTYITNKGYNRISNAELFNFAEGLLNKYPYLSIENIIGGKESSNVEIRLLNSDSVNFKGLTDDIEEFRFGATLANTNAHTSLGDFALRQICTNGMVGIKTNEQFKLGATTEQGLFQMFEHITKMEKANFIPEDFAQSIETAHKIPASFAEIENAVKQVGSRIVGEFPEQTEGWKTAMETMFFPAYHSVLQRMKHKEIDPTELTKKQKQFIKTDMNVWELVNALTDLGSNQTPYVIQNKSQLQNVGGQVFRKEYDLKDIFLIDL